MVISLTGGLHTKAGRIIQAIASLTKQDALKLYDYLLFFTIFSVKNIVLSLMSVDKSIELNSNLSNVGFD